MNHVTLAQLAWLFFKNEDVLWLEYSVQNIGIHDLWIWERNFQRHLTHGATYLRVIRLFKMARNGMLVINGSVDSSWISR